MKNLLFFLVSLLALPSAQACMNMKAVFHLNGEEFKVDQKVDQDQTYSFMKGPYVINVTLPSGQESGTHLIKMKIDKKSGTDLTTVSSPIILVRDSLEAEMSTQASETNEVYKVRLTVRNI